MRCLRMAVILLVASLLFGCSGKKLPEFSPTQADVTTKWQRINLKTQVGDALCFSEKSVTYVAETPDGDCKVFEVSFDSGDVSALTESLPHIPNIMMLCDDGSRLCFISGIAVRITDSSEDPVKMRYSIAGLYDGELREFTLSEKRTPAYPEPVLYNSNLHTAALPCREGFAVKFVDTYIDEYKNVYSVRLFDTNAENTDCYRTLVEGIVDINEVSGKRFISSMSRDGEAEFLWLLSEELEEGKRTAPPRLEKYNLDGELLETRELSDWDGMANMIEERHELPYDAGAAEFAVLGKNGRYLYINYQADAVFLEWKNGKYRQLGSPSVPEESATTLKQFYSVPPKCSGCKNSGDSHLADLFWFYKLSDLARPELLYAFDASSGRLFSVSLPVEPDDSCLDYISASCCGDILLQRYRWQDQSRLEPEETWLLTAGNVAGAMG